MPLVNNNLKNLINNKSEKEELCWLLYNKYEEELSEKLKNSSDKDVKKIIYRFGKKDFLEVPLIYELIANKRITLLQQLYQEEYPMSYQDWDGGNALHVSCGASGSLDAVKFFIENNIFTDINKKSLKYGETPLTLAILYNHNDIIKYFSKKFNVNSIKFEDMYIVINALKQYYKRDSVYTKNPNENEQNNAEEKGYGE